MCNLEKELRVFYVSKLDAIDYFVGDDLSAEEIAHWNYIYTRDGKLPRLALSFLEIAENTGSVVTIPKFMTMCNTKEVIVQQYWIFITQFY